LLFLRLSRWSGLEDEHINPSLLRDTFAVRYLLAGGDLGALQEVLDRDDPVSAKRYQRFCTQLNEQSISKGHPADQSYPRHTRAGNTRRMASSVDAKDHEQEDTNFPSFRAILCETEQCPRAISLRGAARYAKVCDLLPLCWLLRISVQKIENKQTSA
jgi:hypothetical protein